MIVSTVSKDTLADSENSWRPLEKVSISSWRAVKCPAQRNLQLASLVPCQQGTHDLE
jgi:hypothetical protein